MLCEKRKKKKEETHTQYTLRNNLRQKERQKIKDTQTTAYTHENNTRYKLTERRNNGTQSGASYVDALRTRGTTRTIRAYKSSKLCNTATRMCSPQTKNAERK